MLIASTSKLGPFEEAKYPDPQSLIGCDYFLIGGRLCEFRLAAPGLVELDIEFDFHDIAAHARVIDIIGPFTWPSLRRLRFSTSMINEVSLIDFFTRHATTLREISLDRLNLDSNDWTSVFRRMAKTLELEKAVLSRIFFDSAGRLWDFGERPEEEGDSLDDEWEPETPVVRNWVEFSLTAG